MHEEQTSDAPEPNTEKPSFPNRLLDAIGTLVVVLDPDYRIVRFNENCERVTGYSADDVEGASLFDRLVPEKEVETVRSTLEAVKAEGTPTQHESHWIPRQGPPVLILWTTRPLSPDTGSGDYLVGTGIDLTERRQLEREAITLSDAERQRIGQDLHNLLSSHLTGTALIAQEIARRIDSGEGVPSDDVREISALIKDAGEQARSLSHSLMPFASQTKSLADGLERLARREEQMSDTTFTVDVNGSIPQLDQEVAAHLYRIASEAVTLMMKYGDPDRVALRLGTEEDVLTLRVQGDGNGVAPDSLSRSSLLGLNVMNYRSNLIGARLEVDSDDAGTQIRCSIPVDRVVPGAAFPSP